MINGLGKVMWLQKRVISLSDAPQGAIEYRIVNNEYRNGRREVVKLKEGRREVVKQGSREVWKREGGF